MKPSARRKARRLALQAIYQWQLNAGDIKELGSQFLKDCNPKKVDIEYFTEIVTETLGKLKEIDQQLIPCLDRDIKEVNPVELAILRIATYELSYRLDVPYKVIINEALESTKTYGAEESFKFVNGVLDKVATNIRK